MSGLAAQGDVNAALQAYREFARLLSSEVSTVPDKETTRLYDRLRADERLRKVPVIFETAVSYEYRREFQRRGIKSVIEKPFSLNEIIRRVHELAPPPRREMH